MSDRREFIKKATLGTIGMSTVYGYAHELETATVSSKALHRNQPNKPLIISTWNHGLPANAEAWKYLESGKPALDAIEAGMRIPEEDPKVRSVG